MQTDAHQAQGQESQAFKSNEMAAFGNIIGQDLSTGRVVATITGTIDTGVVAVVAQGEILNGLSSLYVKVRNRADSLGAITFTLEQVVWTAAGFQVFLIGTVTVNPAMASFFYFGLPSPNTKSTLRIVGNAAHTYPAGVDNYTIDISGF